MTKPRKAWRTLARQLGGMTLPSGTVRNTRSRSRFGTRSVELLSPGLGDIREGDLRVPRELVADMKDVQLKHRRQQYITFYVNRWVAARERGQLYPHYRTRLTDRPKVTGPFEAPKDNPDAESPDWVIYRVSAHFKPQETVLASFTDIAEIERRAEIFGVDLWDQRPESPMPKRTKAVIQDDGKFHDPMQIAEERRQALGIKREDYFVPEWHRD